MFTLMETSSNRSFVILKRKKVHVLVPFSSSKFDGKQLFSAVLKAENESYFLATFVENLGGNLVFPFDENSKNGLFARENNGQKEWFLGRDMIVEGGEKRK